MSAVTVKEFIDQLKALPQDAFLNFEVKDKYVQSEQMEFEPENINIYPGNVWITLDLDESKYLEI